LHTPDRQSTATRLYAGINPEQIGELFEECISGKYFATILTSNIGLLMGHKQRHSESVRVKLAYQLDDPYRAALATHAVDPSDAHLVAEHLGTCVVRQPYITSVEKKDPTLSMLEMIVRNQGHEWDF
jgi:hypothetical protein